MNRQLTLSLATVAFISTALSLCAQNKSNPVAQLDVGSIRAIPQVYVDLRLRAPDLEIFVPYCGESEGGGKVLCVAATRLEVETKTGWHPAKLRTTYGVLGALSLDRARGVLIAPKNEASFSFQFSTYFFEVAPGQRLRVVVDAWSNEESMKTGGPSMQFVSPPFKCPDGETRP